MPAPQATVQPSLRGLPRHLQAGETRLADGPDQPPRPRHLSILDDQGGPARPSGSRLVKKKLHLAFVSLKQDFQNGL